ncbi:PREDICTED: facilitated trehalose transporter Tret1-2 homolog [Nicrophorus vespilloides]|uniref:Facilitated trehalose transporter Tret1-2 homolog n=1 Tax=Nicrophorus vespilloides TaxID=110193 RepID=A0ABM1NIV5_NICVS|nr:PREDICTED: facilitated trehalose transporter Tret1-2 homolog [Nicrophorus vespilloides]XP_017786756.1 PREDICTED: facilitated trehalose transporter Tret1-2 homolog [Nicrophorus vespilloides]
MLNDKKIQIVPSNPSLNVDKSKEAFGSLLDDIQETTFKPLYRQTIGSLGPILLTICGGMVSGYSAILLPQLEYKDSPIKATKNEESWIASLAPLPMAAGCIFGGWMMDRFGRKKSNILGTIFLTIGWVFIYQATSVEYIMVGRLITGFFIGTTGPSSTIYIGEICEPRYRGIFLATIALGVALGLFIAHILGTFLAWQVTALIMAACPIAAFIFIIISPESHIWYANRNDYKRAMEAFFWLRGNNEASRHELSIIFESRTKDTKKRSWKELLAECSKPQFYKPLMILSVFFTTVQFAGQNAVVFYSVTIMQKTVTTLDKYAAMLIVDFIRVCISICACVLTKKFKVRPLTIVSGIGTFTSLFGLALFVYLSELYPENKTFSVMPLVMLISYIVCISTGIVPLPWALCGELFAQATKGIGGGISTTINFLTFFAVVKTSPDMFDTLGTAGTFGTYGVFAFTGTVILYFVLPETKNKTLKEIEAHFTKVKKPILNKPT